MINKSISDTINTMIPIESILKDYLSNVFTGSVKQNRPPSPVKEDFSNLIDNQAIGLGDDPGRQPGDFHQRDDRALVLLLQAPRRRLQARRRSQRARHRQIALGRLPAGARDEVQRHADVHHQRPGPRRRNHRSRISFLVRRAYSSPIVREDHGMGADRPPCSISTAPKYPLQPFHLSGVESIWQSLSSGLTEQTTAQKCSCWGFMDAYLSGSSLSCQTPSPLYLLFSSIVALRSWRSRRNRTVSGRLGIL